jgi:hypothetical protein
MEAPGQLQTKTSTRENRYPETFAAAERMSGVGYGRRVLSFGCSKGLEGAALHDRYFTRTDDSIVAVDINRQILETAMRENSRPRVRYQHSHDHEFLSDSRFFDVIFALAVFAVTGSDDQDNIGEAMPFTAFERGCAYLDSRLRVGGVLVITCSNYRFTDLAMAARYEAHADPSGRSSENLRVFDPNGIISPAQDYPLTLFRKLAR